MIRILGFAGSLRKDSYNRALLNAAQKLAPAEAEIEIFDIGDFPLFNEDLEATPPQMIIAFKEKIVQADAVLIVTPEYNYSISGVLKNALDWASRPYGSDSFSGKAVAIMGAATGTLGTARAQYHLRQICVFLNCHVLNRPEIMVASAAQKFRDGELADDKTQQKVREQLIALVALAKQLQKA